VPDVLAFGFSRATPCEMAQMRWDVIFYGSPGWIEKPGTTDRALPETSPLGSAAFYKRLNKNLFTSIVL
jgi:hypothetical protein